MPKVGCSFTAKGGTVFAWDPNDPQTDIEVIIRGDRANDYALASDPPLGPPPFEPTLHVKIPGADLNEFVEYIIGSAVAESVVLLFPSLQKLPAAMPDPPKDAA